MSWRTRKPSKYYSKKIKDVASGHSFSSGLERNTYNLLKIFEKEGEIKDIQVQDHVYLTDARILYIPDFKIFDIKLNEHVWIESKGFPTPVWAIKRRLWIAGYGPGILRVYVAGGTFPIMKEELDARKFRGK